MLDHLEKRRRGVGVFAVHSDLSRFFDPVSNGAVVGVVPGG